MEIKIQSLDQIHEMCIRDRLLMQDTKEAAEHATIVDLIRNDLSMVAEHVEVTSYRYIDRCV